MAERGLKVFVSSSIRELKKERESVRRALDELELVSFTYENDAPASMGSHQDVWRAELEDAGICIAIIHKKAGIHTQDEINTARDGGVPLLVYRRELPDGEKLPPQEQDFVDKLDNPVDGIAVRLYEKPKSLAKRVRRDIPDLLAEWAKIVRKQLKKKRAKATGARKSAEPTDDGLATEEAKGPSIEELPPENARRIAANESAFVGRAAQTTKLADFLGMKDRRIAVVGDPGSGRKAILRHFAHDRDLSDGFAHGTGIHPMQQPGDDLEDIRQAIWEEFFVAENLDPSLVDPKRRRRDLAGRNALIFLLDLDLPDDQINELAADMPKSKLVVTRSSDAPWSAKTISLPPLDSTDEIMQLFEDRYNSTVPAAAAASIVEAATNLGGIPARIEILANRAWDEAADPGDDGTPHPLIEWAREKAALAPPELLRWLIPHDEAEVAEVMAAVATHTPREVLADVIDINSRAEEALADGVAISASPRYALNPALADAVTAGPDDQAILDRVFDATMTWVVVAGHDRIYRERGFILRMLEVAAHAGNHAGVIALARAAEHAFAMGGRHGAWRQALERALTAAEALGDPDAAAWALHQLGTRALLRDELDDARELLHDALEIREELDPEAAEVTRGNLKLIPMAITSLASLVLLVLLAVGWGAGLAVGGDGWPVDTDIGRATEDNPDPQPQPEITTTAPSDTTPEPPDDGTTTTTTEPDDSTTTTTVGPPSSELVVADPTATPDTVPSTGGVVTLLFGVDPGEDQRIVIDDVQVVIGGIDPTTGTATCVGQEISRRVECSVDVDVSGPPGVVVLDVTVAGRDGDDRATVATGSAAVTVLDAPQRSVALRQPSVTISDGMIELRYGIVNTGVVPLEGVVVSHDLPGPVECPSNTIAPGGVLTCSAVHTPTPAEVDAQGVTATATVTAADLETRQRVGVTARFGVVNPTFAVDARGSLEITLNGTVTIVDVGRSVDPITVPLVVAEGIGSLSIFVPDSFTLQQGCGSSSTPLPLAGPAVYETTVTASTTAATPCGFTLVGEAVVEVDQPLIEIRRGQRVRLIVRNLGSRAATGFSFVSPDDFSVEADCSTLEPEESCAAMVSYVGSDEDRPSVASLELTYAGGTGDTRVVLSYRP